MAQDRHEPWRVRVLFSQADVAAVIERAQFRDTLAIEETKAAGGTNVGRESPAVSLDPYLVGD
jgi:hypothetical protein